MSLFLDSFVDEIEKISVGRVRRLGKKVWPWVRGAAAGTAVTGLAMPATGYTLGRLKEPKTKKEAREAIHEPEVVFLHSVLPGYSEYMYARKSRARGLLKGRGGSASP